MIPDFLGGRASNWITLVLNLRSVPSSGQRGDYRKGSACATLLALEIKASETQGWRAACRSWEARNRILPRASRRSAALQTIDFSPTALADDQSALLKPPSLEGFIPAATEAKLIQLVPFLGKRQAYYSKTNGLQNTTILGPTDRRCQKRVIKVKKRGGNRKTMNTLWKKNYSRKHQHISNKDLSIHCTSFRKSSLYDVRNPRGNEWKLRELRGKVKGNVKASQKWKARGSEKVMQ